MRNPHVSRHSKKNFWQMDRLSALRYVVMFLAGILIVRLFFLQVVNSAEYQDLAVKKYSKTLVLPAERGKISITSFDSEEDHILATNTTQDLLYVDPKALKEGFDEKREKLSQKKMNEKDFPFESYEKYIESLADSLAVILAKNPKEMQYILTRKYNDHITLAFEPAEDVIFRLKEKPIPGVFLWSELDKKLDEMRFESEEVKLDYVKGLREKERTKMQETYLEVFIDPTKISDSNEVNVLNAASTQFFTSARRTREIAKELNQLFPEYSLEKIERLLVRKELRYQPILNRLTLEASLAIKDLNIYGFVLQPESWRLYPEGDLLSNLIGFVDRERKGQYGLEGQYDLYLRGTDGYKILDTDFRGNQITVGDETEVLPQNGFDLKLTIDRSIQKKVEEVLRDTVQMFLAVGGQIIVMEPQTGAILAMASYPTFNPNEFYKVYERDENSGKFLNGVGPEAFFNSAVAATYEPGSTQKILTEVIALESGEFQAEDTVCDHTGKVEIEVPGREKAFTIRNSTLTAHGCMTFAGLLEKSSNIGALRLSLKVGAGVFRNGLLNFGFGEFTDIGLDDENRGYLKDIKEWGKVALANAGFGQGFTVTPMQLVRAVGAVANQGKLMRPFVIAEKISEGNGEKTSVLEVRRAMSPGTAQKVTEFMVQSVDNGFAKKGGVAGYSVAGKTGTSQIALPGGGYSTTDYYTSFVGFAPANDPKFVMLVKLDKPILNKFGEGTAAPAFGKIAEYILKYWNIPRDR